MSSAPAQPATGAFTSPAEFRDVIDRTFALMCEDPEVGPKLRFADVPQRFVFPDLQLAVSVRAGIDEEPNLVWDWAEQPGWEPRVTLTMDSEVANRYFQGRENVAIAIARRRIGASGDVRATLALLPLIRPLFARYRAMVAAEYPHLEL